MVSEEQLEFSENGNHKKGLFKVFWRGLIKQYSCEMGFGKYNALDLGGGFRGEGRTRGDRNGCEQEEKCQARADSVHMDTIRLVPHSSGPHSSPVPSFGGAAPAHASGRSTGEDGSYILALECKTTLI